MCWRRKNSCDLWNFQLWKGRAKSSDSGRSRIARLFVCRRGYFWRSAMKTQEHFYCLADRIQNTLETGEQFTCLFSGEKSDFIRLNHASVIQAGSVTQGYLQVSLISGAKQAGFVLGVSGDLERDGDYLESLFKKQRSKIEHLPEDPYLLISKTPH